MTAVTSVASGIAFGAYDVAIAGGVEHMGRHPMGEGVDPNPRIVAEKLVDPSALVMGSTAENLHDRFPAITKDRADAFAVLSQDRVAAAYADGMVPLVVVSVVFSAVAAFFYLRVVVVMFFNEPHPDGPTVTVPGVFTTVAISIGTLSTVLLGVVPGPVLDFATVSTFSS